VFSDYVKISFYRLFPLNDIEVPGQKIVDVQPGQALNTIFQELRIAAREISTSDVLVENDVSTEKGLPRGPVKGQ
jgi:hypothetical protein